MAEPARVEMVVNPTSGRGRGAAAAKEAEARLRSLGAQVRVRSGSTREEGRRQVAEALAERPDAIVLVGGDGTLGNALDQLVSADVPVVFVPAGTGNDFGRALGLPFGREGDAAAAAELAVRGRLLAVDVAEAVCPDGHTMFLTVAPIGFDALVAERTNRLRWPKGGARYYLALVIELLRLRPLSFELRVDDGALEHAPGILVAVGNTSSYGGGMPICPGADPSDGLLDITHVAPMGRLKLIRLFPKLLTGRHLERPEATARRAKSIELSAPGLIVYADGERVGTGSVRIALRPGELRVLVPEEA